MYSNVTTSTRNKYLQVYIRTSVVCFIRNYYIGLLANNATWCQNRGCICISSTRRTYSRIHAVSCIHPVIQTNYKNNNSVNRIISKEKEREDPKRDSSKTSFQLESKSVSSVSTCNPASYKLILYTELILPQETTNTRFILCRLTTAVVSPCIQAFYTAESSSKHPTVFQPLLQHKQASSNSKQQKEHSTRQPAYTQPFQQLPDAYYKEST